MAVDIARVRGKEDIIAVLSAAEQQQAIPTTDVPSSTLPTADESQIETTVAATPEHPSSSPTNLTALLEKQAISLPGPSSTSQHPSSDTKTSTASTSTAEQKTVTHAVPLPSNQTTETAKQTTSGHSLEVYTFISKIHIEDCIWLNALR